MRISEAHYNAQRRSSPPVRDFRPCHLGQFGARMRRHADSISEWNNLFTNLPATGRLEFTEEVDKTVWRAEEPLTAG